MTGLDAFFRNLENAKKEILEECEMVAHETAAHMERYAKEKRRWKDRSSDARKGLNGKARRTKKEISAEIRQDLYGNTGKEYGYWLENAERFHGNYAILKPTRDACQEIDIRVNFLTRVFCGAKNIALCFNPLPSVAVLQKPTGCRLVPSSKRCFGFAETRRFERYKDVPFKTGQHLQRENGGIVF